MKRAASIADNDPARGFCALKYLSPEGSGTRSHDGTVIIIAVASEKGALHLRVRPDWRSIVHASDQEYFASLLGDCKDRAATDPAALFEQMSSLGVGPLVTHETGRSLAAHPELMDRYRAFVDL